MTEAVTIDYSKPLKNARYEAFCQFYYISKNATRSAKDAKYSEKTADVKGSQLLRIVSVKKRLEYLTSLVAIDCKLTVQSIVADIKDTHRRAKIDEDFKNELKASDMLMKHVGGYEKDNEQSKIVIERPLTEQELKTKLNAIESAGNGLDESSIG